MPRNPKSQDGYRVCSICKKEFPETQEFFGKQRTVTNAKGQACLQWRTECLDCRRKQRNASAARHRDTTFKRNKRWYAENAETYNEQRRQEYAESPEIRESAIERSKQYQKENPDYVNAKNKKWSKKHPEKRRVAGQKRRNRMKDTEGELTPELIKEVYDGSGGICAYCGRDCSMNWHLDHIIPIARGGTNHRDNLCVACPPCNLSKGDRLLSEWQVPDYVLDRDLNQYSTGAKSVVWNGILYSSMRQAAIALGIKPSTLKERLDKGYVCDDDMQRHRKP